MTLSPDEESDLRWALAGPSFGMRSWLGPMQDKMASGQVGCSTSREPRDYAADAQRFARVHERLERLTGEHRDAIEAYYRPFDVRGTDPDWKKGDAPPDHGHVRAPLAEFGDLGKVMVALSGLDRAGAEADARAARKGDARAAQRVAALRARAEALLAAATTAYAATRPERRRAG